MNEHLESPIDQEPLSQLSRLYTPPITSLFLEKAQINGGNVAVPESQDGLMS